MHALRPCATGSDLQSQREGKLHSSSRTRPRTPTRHYWCVFVQHVSGKHVQTTSYTSIGCPIRPTSHPTRCTHLSRTFRIIPAPSNPFPSAKPSSPRPQLSTVSRPNIPPCWFTTVSTLSTHAFHSSRRRGNSAGASDVCVSAGCVMMWLVNAERKINVSAGWDLSFCNVVEWDCGCEFDDG